LKNQLAARVASTPQPTVVDLISIGDVAIDIYVRGPRIMFHP